MCSGRSWGGSKDTGSSSPGVCGGQAGGRLRWIRLVCRLSSRGTALTLGWEEGVEEEKAARHSYLLALTTTAYDSECTGTTAPCSQIHPPELLKLTGLPPQSGGTTVPLEHNVFVPPSLPTLPPLLTPSQRPLPRQFLRRNPWLFLRRALSPHGAIRRHLPPPSALSPALLAALQSFDEPLPRPTRSRRWTTNSRGRGASGIPLPPGSRRRAPLSHSRRANGKPRGGSADPDPSTASQADAFAAQVVQARSAIGDLAFDLVHDGERVPLPPPRGEPGHGDCEGRAG